MSTTRQLVMVIGPGRSGTSVLTKVLAELGYHIPQPEIAADETNPSGFGESAWMVDFHREMLKASQVQNSDARPAAFVDTLATAEEKTEYRDRAAGWLDGCFAEVDFVLVKDPRLLWFTTLWEQVAAELDIGTACHNAATSDRGRCQQAAVVRVGTDDDQPACGMDERHALHRASDTRSVTRFCGVRLDFE